MREQHDLASESLETIVASRAILQREFEHRRERRWSIFTWASTLLVAITGATLALQLQTGLSFPIPQKILLSAAVGVLALYSCMWWESHRRYGRAVAQQLKQYDERLGISWPKDWGVRVGRFHVTGSLYTLILLGVAAITAIWLPPT